MALVHTRSERLARVSSRACILQTQCATVRHTLALHGGLLKDGTVIQGFIPPKLNLKTDVYVPNLVNVNYVRNVRL